MRLRRLVAMISTINDYSLLKLPLIIVSVLITLLAFILLLSFRSNAWFTYESIDIDSKSTISNTTIKYSHLLEYGSFGLWLLCVDQYNDPIMKCDRWIRQTRPEHFSVIVVLVSCALFLSNLTIFPSWASSILILYNTNNRYIRHIVVFLWIIFFLTLTFTTLLICVMIFIGSTKFYSPGIFIINTKQISFYNGPGVLYMLYATIIAIICLVLVFIILIWKKFIEMRLIEDARELYKQLSDDNFQPGWHRIIMIPRSTSTGDDSFSEPPPYNSH